MPLLYPQRLNGTLRFPIDGCIRNEAVGVAPALTEVVRKAHIRKDVTHINKRAEAYVKAAESLALERSQSSTVTGETASASSNQQLTAASIEMATNVDAENKESPAVSLLRNVGVDGYGRLITVGVVTGLKDDGSKLKQSIDLLSKLNGVDPISGESGASAPSPHSDSSQELNQHTPTH